MSFPKYPAYKDSGVKWLSDVPEHWDVRRNKQVFRLVSVQVGKKSADFQLLSLTLRGVIPRDIESGKGKFPAEFDTYQVVEPNDIVFCLFDIDETPRTVGISSDFGMITGAYTVAKTLPVADPRFVYYYYFSIDLRKGLRPFYTGLRKVVRPETFLNIELPLPPLSEQANICNFLDHETARIDALIEEQQRLIELLKEKRQAVISHAVTKGLDPTVPMKESGVEWLGEVPAHWGVKNMKHISSLKGRLGWQGLKAEEYRDEGPFVVSSAHFNNFSIDWDACPHVSGERYDLDSNIQLCEGDVLLMKDGAALGKLAFIDHLPDRACLNSHLLLFRPVLTNQYITYISKFLFLFMRTEYFQKHITLYATGTTFAGISQEKIGNYRMALPPLEEQNAIVRFLEVEIVKFDTLIVEAQRTTDLLQERRSALISAAVTGKIDVRGWLPPANTQAPESAVAGAH